MKKSEKEDLSKFIDNLSCRISLVAFGGSIIDTLTLKKYIDKIPTDKEDIKEIYAIRDLTTGNIIWSARGSAYKEMEEVEKKIRKLKLLAQNKDKEYKIITYKLEE